MGPMFLSGRRRLKYARTAPRFALLNTGRPGCAENGLMFIFAGDTTRGGDRHRADHQVP